MGVIFHDGIKLPCAVVVFPCGFDLYLSPMVFIYSEQDVSQKTLFALFAPKYC